jgi:hypothetical protein
LSFICLINFISRTKEDEQEEIKIREELKAIDAVLKKNKKAVSFFILCFCSLLFVNIFHVYVG